MIMITFIRKILSTFFLIIFLLLSAPTLLFLTKWYYSNLVMTKTYIGVLDIPYAVDKSEETISAAKTLFASTDIRAIIINCDGVGGIPGACQAIYDDLVKLKHIYKKPIVSFIEKECLAGNYLIASAADYIVATEGAIIGHLNDFAYHYTLGQMYTEKLHQEYRDLFEKTLSRARPKLEQKKIMHSEKNLMTGSLLLEVNAVDFLGAHMEVERLLRTKTVIDGSIEKVHGSFVEHFVFYVSDLVNRTISHFKKK
jgi:hypothetical protein